jgi:dienelactone hydrolase/predicted Ser/Thr protein kinase
MVGRSISHYQITEKLGAGGMGEVFLANDLLLGRQVALKFISRELKQDPAAHKRLLREAKAAAALDHPSICSIHEVAEAEGQNFIVMEYVEGQSLRDRLLTGPLPIRDALRLASEIAEGLEAAHEKGIVHRDLKPANIMITRRGHAKVMDFGLAKYGASVSPAGSYEETITVMTRSGTTMGTPAYMSPEQLRGAEVDARSDVFTFGIVLYEMLAGVRPFARETEIDTASAILHETPPALSQQLGAVSGELQRLLDSMLAKKPGDRISAREVGSELARLIRQTEAEQPIRARSLAARLRRTFSRPYAVIPALIVILAGVYFGYQRVEYNRKAGWARDIALPEVARLTENGDLLGAFNLAAQAEEYLPQNTKALAELRSVFSRPASIASDPPGAMVSWKPYSQPQSDWRPLGPTPIRDAPVPAVYCRLEIEKPGYPPLFRASSLAQEISVKLDAAGTLPADMVRVPESVFNLPLPGLDCLKEEPLGAFLIDKYEVTNRAFKTFLDGGGYQDRKYWKQTFVADGRTLTWEEAMDRFKDRTGRKGPATWEAGDYPEGQDDYPVSGVSWYEAAAFAEYAGKNLPTIYHWYTAAGMAASTEIVPLSNFGASGPAAVGSYQGLGPFGTYDMAGNVREWCWNGSSRAGQRFILGGGWNDPAYAFDSDAVAQPPFDRSATNGFRCIRYLGESQDEAAAARTIQLSFRDFFKETPASDKEFEIYLRQYAYDQAPLNVEMISRDASAAGWTRETVSFDAAHGGERMLAHLYLPKNAAPPYQVVFFWPGDSGLQIRTSEAPWLSRWFDFIIKSGRAVLFPVFKSMFERADPLQSTVPNETNTYKEHVVMWMKELRRSIDYLQTRPDINTSRLAYYGLSWGGRMSGIALAVEDRFKTAVLCVAGFRFPRSLPEVDPFNFVSRVKIPVLMLNGRYDHYFPVETAQKPMFEFLGTPEEHKKWIVYDGGHFVPRDQLIKETLAWLDRYLGAVK